MSVETATYISDLNASNPASGDARSEGDDHLRLLKSTIKATFPSVTGAVTATHTELNVMDGITATTTELNYCDGVTSAIQTQLDSKGAAMVARASSSLSGTAVDLTTGISSTTTQIDVYLSDASLSGSDNLLIQLGDSGGVETTGYVGTYAYATGQTAASVTTVGSTSETGFVIRSASGTVNSFGAIRLRRVDPSSNVWTIEGQVFFGASNDKVPCWFFGTKTLSAAITTVRVTRTGTNTFDAGTVYYVCN